MEEVEQKNSSDKNWVNELSMDEFDLEKDTEDFSHLLNLSPTE